MQAQNSRRLLFAQTTGFFQLQSPIEIEALFDAKGEGGGREESRPKIPNPAL
jgi:hypothetical protein